MPADIAVVVVWLPGDILAEPRGRDEGVCLLHAGEFHFRQDERGRVLFEDIQFDGVAPERDAVSFFGNIYAVRFWPEMLVGLR